MNIKKKITNLLGSLSSRIFSVYNNPAFSRNITFVIATVIIIFGTILRLSHYISKPMWFDEVWVLVVARRSFIDIVRNLYYDLHQPLYYFIVKILGYFSQSDAVRKLPSLVSGIITLIVFFNISRKLCDKKTALVATYLLSISTAHITFSQMLRMYTMVTLFSLLSTYMLFQFLDSGGARKKMLGYAGFTSLALHTQVVAGFLFISHCCFIIYSAIESFVIRVLSGDWKKKTFVKFVLALITFLFFLIMCFLFLHYFVLPKDLSPAEVLSEKKTVLFLSGIVFLTGSFLLSLISLAFLHKDTPLKPLINATTLKRGMLMLILLIAFSPIFIYCLSGSFLAYYTSARQNIPSAWTPMSLKYLGNIFNFNLIGQYDELTFGLGRVNFFSHILFPLGIILAFIRGKRWALLFALHSISVFAFILLFGYCKTYIALNTRHFLLTLPPIILFVSIGLVWGAESLFNFFLYLVKFPIKIATKIIPNFKNRLPNQVPWKGISRQAKNIFVILIVLYVLINNWDAAFRDVRGWYNQRWQDFHAFGEFLNKNLKPGTLIFFANQAFQYHAVVNTDKRTGDLIFHPSNFSQKERLVWQAVDNTTHTQEEIKALEDQGFRLIHSFYPPEGLGRLYEKRFPVRSPLVISGDSKGIWSYKDTFDGFQFVRDAYSIKNLRRRPACLFPTVSDEPCSIIYHFVLSSDFNLESFIIKAKINTGTPSHAKVKLSLDGQNFTEIKQVNQPESFSIDITERIGKARSFYVEFELFAKWIPRIPLDAMETVFLTEVNFQASCGKNL